MCLVCAYTGSQIACFIVHKISRVDLNQLTGGHDLGDEAIEYVMDVKRRLFHIVVVH